MWIDRPIYSFGQPSHSPPRTAPPSPCSQPQPAQGAPGHGHYFLKACSPPALYLTSRLSTQSRRVVCSQIRSAHRVCLPPLHTDACTQIYPYIALLYIYKWARFNSPCCPVYFNAASFPRILTDVEMQYLIKSKGLVSSYILTDVEKHCIPCKAIGFGVIVPTLHLPHIL